MTKSLIPLAEAISALRSELAIATAQAKGQALRFDVGPIELELHMVVEREATAEGKLQFKIFGWGADAGGGVTASDQRTQKVKLTLTPVAAGGGKLQVSDEED